MKLTDAELCCDEQLYPVIDLLIKEDGHMLILTDHPDVYVNASMPACKMRMLAKILNETADRMEGKV